MDVLWSLPTDGEGNQAVRVLQEGTSLAVVFAYWQDGQPLYGRLKFEHVLAHDFAAEPVSFMLGALPKAYDRVIDAGETDWSDRYLSEYKLPGPKDWRHFATYLSNCGFINVLAKSVVLEADIKADSIDEVVRS